MPGGSKINTNANSLGCHEASTDHDVVPGGVVLHDGLRPRYVLLYRLLHLGEASLAGLNACLVLETRAFKTV